MTNFFSQPKGCGYQDFPFSDRLLGELCARHGISQSLFYKWRDQFFKYGERVFEATQTTRQEDRLMKENRRLKSVVGELTMELKKSDYDM